MKRPIVILLMILVAGAVMSAAADRPRDPRPRDPFVFRCVLDGNPRMVVIALHEELWLAYDAASCGLHQVWRDGVNFDGAVYTTVHGPQPTSRGEPDFTGPERAVWRLVVDGEVTDVAPFWRGYSLRGPSVTLNFKLPLPGGGAVRIEETPMMDAFGSTPDRPARVDRQFTVRGLPDGVRAQLVIARDRPDRLDRFTLRGKHTAELKREAVAGADAAQGPEQERLILTLTDDGPAVLSMDLDIAAE